jgi:hypothetical protein
MLHTPRPALVQTACCGAAVETRLSRCHLHCSARAHCGSAAAVMLACSCSCAGATGSVEVGGRGHCGGATGGLGGHCEAA